MKPQTLSSLKVINMTFLFFQDEFMETSMKTGVQLFRQFVVGLEKENNQNRKKVLNEKNGELLMFC